MTNETKIYTDEQKKKFEKRVDAESRPLFKALLEFDQPNAVTCAELQRVIKEKYGRDKPIKPKFLYQWSGESGNLKALQKWLFSAAIDLLWLHKVNPITVIPAYKVAEHWSRLRRNQMTYEEACERFMQEFKPVEQDKASIQEIIKQQYEYLESEPE